MDMHIDDRGKYFTPWVNKETVVAAVRTTEHLIVGEIYVRPDQRLKDEFNLSQERFLAVTNASVYDIQGVVLLFESEFLIVASNRIVFITPVEAVKPSPQLTWLPAKALEGSA